MAGRILIIDTVATNRIVLKVKLATAGYHPVVCGSEAEALNQLQSGAPDMIIIGANSLSDPLMSEISALRGGAGRLALPLIAITEERGTDARAALLRVEVDDVLERPLTDTLLLARVRSLLRSRVAASDLRMREETSMALGFSDGPAPFAATLRLALIAPSTTQAVVLGRMLKQTGLGQVSMIDPEEVFRAKGGRPMADLYVIDARVSWSVACETTVFGLISDLRSRAESRHAPILLMTAEGDFNIWTMAYDLGAEEVVDASISSGELALRLGSLARLRVVMESLRDRLRTGMEAAVQDPLTGLHNRRYAIPQLTQMRRSARRSGGDLAVMLVDIDHFKRLNDQHGHAAGDLVLVEVARRLRAELRAEDLVARIGGEEFLVAISRMSRDQALATAERLRKAMCDVPIRIGDTALAVTVTMSVGVAFDTPQVIGERSEDLIAMADAALYRAKGRGRNMVTVCRSAA